MAEKRLAPIVTEAVIQSVEFLAEVVNGKHTETSSLHFRIGAAKFLVEVGTYHALHRQGDIADGFPTGPTDADGSE